MAENIGGNDLLSTGGHRWVWSPRAQSAKVLATAGIDGAARNVIHNGPRGFTIAGAGGEPAILKASDNSRAMADLALAALEWVIEDLIAAGTPVAWEDDQGHTGTALVLTSYDRQGERLYGSGGLIVWQMYVLRGVELLGGF